MSRDATGIYSKMATALTRCPTCKAKKGAPCDMTVEGSQEHNTHFARTQQPISSAKQNAYLHPDDKYKKGLVVVGALGVLKDRTPAYVEAVVVDALGRRWAWGEYGYEYPEHFDPSDICMTSLPCFKADRRKHVLLLGAEDLETLSGWDKPPTKTVAKFVAWICEGDDKDPTLGACRLDGGAAWLALPSQSEAVLKYLAQNTMKQLRNEALSYQEVEHLAWRLQRCARGATTYMAHAAIAFESIERRDLSEAMARACTAPPNEWQKAKRRASYYSRRWVLTMHRLCKEGLKRALAEGHKHGSNSTTLKYYLSAEEPSP